MHIYGDAFTEMRVRWSVTLADRLGLEILTVLEIETSFASCAFTFEGFLIGCQT